MNRAQKRAAQKRAAQFKRGMRTNRNYIEDPSAVLRPINWSRKFTEEEVGTISTEARLAWHRLINGQGDENAFNIVGTVINILAVAVDDLDPLAQEVPLRAQDAMNEMQARYGRTGRFGADAAALATVPDALAAYDAVLAELSARQMVALAHKTDEMVRQARALRAGGA